MRSFGLCWFLFSVSLLTLSAAPSAHAAPFAGARLTEDNVDELTARATKLRHNGDDEGALPLYQQAYDRSRSPAAAARLALCKQALGQWAEAETFLTEGLKASDDAWIRKNRRQLEQSLVAIKTHIARVEVIGEPVGAEVLVNGSMVGKLPLSSLVRVGAGEIQIEVRSPGYTDANRTFRVEGGQYQKVAIRLSPLAAAFPAGVVNAGPAPLPPTTNAAVVIPPARLGASSAASSGAAFAPSPATAGDPAANLTGTKDGTTTGTDGSGGSTWRPRYKWLAWGGAALALGVGLYGWTENRSAVKTFDAGCGIEAASGQVRAIAGSGRTNAQCEGLKDDYESASTLGIGGFVGAGVLGALGAILWMTEPEDVPRSGQSLSYACRPLLNAPTRAGAIFSAGMTCAWHY